MHERPSGREQSQPGGGAARRPRGGSAGSQGARPTGGAKRSGAKTVRLQLHLEEATVKRLGVHCALAQRSQSALVGEILESWLSRFGKGRELFGPAEPADSGTSEGQGDLAAPAA